MKIGPRSVATLVLTALACAGLAAAAFAGVVKYDTKLGAGKAIHSYFDRVQSKVGKCEHGRLVVLFAKLPRADRKAGTDRSNRDGGWAVNPHGGDASMPR
jgi:hypothetical protein